MKLTIEAVYEKFIGRTDKFPEHFEDFTADIQAYVKQEMKGLIPTYHAHTTASDILSAIENYGKEK